MPHTRYERAESSKGPVASMWSRTPCANQSPAKAVRAVGPARGGAVVGLAVVEGAPVVGASGVGACADDVVVLIGDVVAVEGVVRRVTTARGVAWTEHALTSHTAARGTTRCHGPRR